MSRHHMCGILTAAIGLIDPASPAVDRGNPAFVPVGETDLDGGARQLGVAVDIGVDESGATELFADSFESGDTSGWSSG